MKPNETVQTDPILSACDDIFWAGGTCGHWSEILVFAIDRSRLQIVTNHHEESHEVTYGAVRTESLDVRPK